MQNKFELTKLFSSLVIGDGSFRSTGEFVWGQIAEHSDYVTMVWDEINKYGVECRIDKREAGIDKRGQRYKEFWTLNSRKLPIVDVLRERWYHEGRKTVSVHDVRNFGWKELARWFMDDGTAPLYTKDLSRNGNMILCSHSFSEAENLLLQRVLYENFNLPFDVRKSNQYRYLFLKKKFSGEFYNGVKPFILPSFEYKLRTIDPDSEYRVVR